MFICLELDTKDMGIWSEIDRLLADELGLTHVLWGVNKRTKEPLHTHLPSNLFISKASCSADQLRVKIEDLIRKVFSSGFNIAVVEEKTWSHNARKTTQLISNLVELDIESMRE